MYFHRSDASPSSSNANRRLTRGQAPMVPARRSRYNATSAAPGPSSLVGARKDDPAVHSRPAENAHSVALPRGVRP